jgi:hypothetical protein
MHWLKRVPLGGSKDGVSAAEVTESHKRWEDEFILCTGWRESLLGEVKTVFQLPRLQKVTRDGKTNSFYALAGESASWGKQRRCFNCRGYRKSQEIARWQQIMAIS